MKRILQTYVEQFLYIALLFTFIALCVLCIALAQATHRLSTRVSFFQSQIQKNRDLNQQLKTLAEENKFLNEQSRKQSYCFVKAFAIYTQNLRPITLEQIIACNSSTEPAKPGSSAVSAPQL